MTTVAQRPQPPWLGRSQMLVRLRRALQMRVGFDMELIIPSPAFGTLPKYNEQRGGN